MKKLLLLVFIAMNSLMMKAQWYEFGNSGLNEDVEFLGTLDNDGVTFRTDDIMRMRLYKRQYSTINGFTGIDQSGFLGISGNEYFFPYSVGAFSRLHLADDVNSDDPNVYAQQIGFRPWQRNGMTLTGNSDQAYVGHKYRRDDESDLVLQWSDNPAEAIWGTDRLRFLFTSWAEGADYGARSDEGLESFRVYVENDTSAFVGIGDWWKATFLNNGNAVDPDERLDILDRTIRIRDFADPNRDYERPLLERFLVADPADGRVYWKDVDPTPPSGVDCSWTLQGPAGSNSNIATAYANNPGCPQADRKIGIGIQSPSHKLHVEHNADPSVGGAIGGGIRSDLKGVDGGNYSGMWSKVAPVGTGSLGTASGSFNEVYKPRTSGTGSLNYVYLTDTEASNVKGYGSIGLVFPNSGVVSEARGLVGEVNRTSAANVSISVGVHANSHGGGTVTHNRGVEARAHSSGSTTTNVGGHITSNIGTTGSATTSYGVYAESGGTGTITNNFGVYAQSIGGTTNHGLKAYCAGGTQNYGVWAQVNDTSTNTWAGHFQGKVKVTGNMWHNNTYIFSDMGLKTELATLTDGNDAYEDLVSGLGSLIPRIYNYTDDAKNRLLINGGQQLGFYAQEVAEVYPQLVSETTLPALVDTAGNVLWEPLSVKGVNYVGLIPVLVAAHNKQEQALVDQEVANAELLDQVQAQHDVVSQLSETVGQLLSRIDQLEQLLALCCQAPVPTDPDHRSIGVEDTGAINPSDDRILRIQPNPFNERTTLYYKLERTGRMQLMANSSDGKQLRVLQEAQLEQGEYQYEWQTADLAPGIYYVTLLLDGEPVVKKAVKVN